eukprot:scaffold100_cov357-Prasinococcus_capsulatus_cf.AAC.9
MIARIGTVVLTYPIARSRFLDCRPPRASVSMGRANDDPLATGLVRLAPHRDCSGLVGRGAAPVAPGRPPLAWRAVR